MGNKPTHCVFVDPAFVEALKNFEPWMRNGNVLECTSVKAAGPYLEVVAVHQRMPETVHSLNIWIPHVFVRAVLWDADTWQIGFGRLEKQDSSTPDPIDPT